MNSLKLTKRALLSSVLALFLCFAMFVGTTFAWFTDSVTSKNNIIQTGSLDAALYYKEPGDSDYKDASRGAIFNSNLWEPGYIDAKIIKIENNGNLAFKYQLSIRESALVYKPAHLRKAAAARV